MSVDHIVEESMFQSNGADHAVLEQNPLYGSNGKPHSKELQRIYRLYLNDTKLHRSSYTGLPQEH